jgi:hypothetical protein
LGRSFHFFRHPAFHHLESRIAIDRCLVLAVQGRDLHDPFASTWGNRPNPGTRRQNQSALNHWGNTVAFKDGDQRLAPGEVGDHPALSMSRLGHNVSAQAFTAFWSRRAKARSVLDVVAVLPEHSVGNIERVVRDKINADPFETDEANHLLDYPEKGGRSFVKQEMGCIAMAAQE